MSKSNKKNAPEKSSDKNANLLVDGSFETAGVQANAWSTFEKVGGWRSDTGIEVWGQDFITKASHGGKVMELDADTRDSRVWQDVKTEAGQSYTFSFDYAQRPDTKAATNTIEVWWNNELVGVVEPGSTAWSKAEFTVKGTGRKDRIEFREQAGDNDSYGGLIDNASLVRSEPAPADDTADEGSEDKGNQPNNDDDKHDGRGHGDGDHNDDGHTDNGQGPKQDNGGEQPPAGDNGGEQPPADDLPTRQIVLSAADILDAKTGAELAGKRGEDDLSGGMGNDHIRGKQGNDVIDGDAGGMLTAPLKISASVSDSVDPDAVTLVVSNLPKGATLSAGKDNGDGSWTLKGSELDGLRLTSPDAGEFALKIQAFAADGSGLSAATEIKVTLTGGFDDVLEGGRGADLIKGNVGDDVIYGGSKPTGQATGREPQPGDDDTIHGGDGNDIIFAGSGHDHVWGDAGDDQIYGGRGNDLLSGGDGNDVIYGNSGDDMVWGDAGDDLVFGGSGDDQLWGGDGNDTLNGGSGNDVFYTDGGEDEINGGSGFDTLVLSSSAWEQGKLGGTVDLSKGIAGRDDWGWDKLSSIEAVIGGYADDTLIGNTKANLLVGGAGDDTIRGGAGADTLTGGEGNDTLVFLGKDVVKLGVSLGVDLITDFEVGDVVDLRDVTSTRGAKYGLVDDGQNTTLVAHIKGMDVEIVKLEGFSGHTLDELIKDGSILL